MMYVMNRKAAFVEKDNFTLLHLYCPSVYPAYGLREHLTLMKVPSSKKALSHSLFWGGWG